MIFLGHGTGIDDVIVMVGVIAIGLFLLRRSERSVRERAELDQPQLEHDADNRPDEIS